jgi:hypothetical protein
MQIRRRPELTVAGWREEVTCQWQLELLPASAVPRKPTIEVYR